MLTDEELNELGTHAHAFLPSRALVMMDELVTELRACRAAAPRLAARALAAEARAAVLTPTSEELAAIRWLSTNGWPAERQVALQDAYLDRVLTAIDAATTEAP